MLASEPTAVASDPFRRSFSPRRKSLLTSLLSIVGDWWGVLATDQLHRYRTNRSRHLHKIFCDIRGHHGKELLWIHLEKPCIVSIASAVMEKSLHMKRRGLALHCYFSS